MKKLFNKIINNILLYDLIFIGINILISFILYILNIRFRLWFIIFIIIISIIGFIIGLFQQIYNSNKNKKQVLIILLIGIIPIILLIVLIMPFIKLIVAFSYRPEHTVTLDDKKYVAVVRSFLHVDVDYYAYYGPLLMGTKVKVHGDFGEGGYDPFVSNNIADSVEYTYYDDNGKVKSKKIVTFIKDSDGNIIDQNSYEINDSNRFNENENYLLPEDEDILYEKKFNETILRFGKVDSILGGNLLVNVLKSTDNGKNFYVVSEDLIQVSNEAKFLFLNKDLGFIISTGKVYLDDNKNGLYVTNDGGKTFISAIFNYQNENVEYINIEGVPYYEDNILKIKGSIYQVNSNKDGYENKELIFISNDLGNSWFLEK